MGARLEGDVGRRTASSRAGGFDCAGFGVRPASAIGSAAANNFAVFHEYAADGWVRCSKAESGRGELERLAHEHLVRIWTSHVSRPLKRSFRGRLPSL